MAHELTLAEAAAVLGLSPATLRSQIRYGKLQGRKVGPVWVLSRRAVDKYRLDHKRG
jgi:excisionase family DNA binding protein